jgi:hydroxypyruvate isomerase
MKAMNRRKAIKAVSGAVVASAVLTTRLGSAVEGEPLYKARNNRIRQSVVHWCFRPMSVEELATESARMGCKSVELVGPEHWPTLKQHGLICAISGSHGFAKGFAHREEHEQCLASLRKSIDVTAEAGWPSVITFSGFRRGLSDEEGIRNMVEGLKKIVGHAEKKKVTLCLEMLNSRVNVEMKGHPDYFCDDIDKSVEICRQVSSERMKVLFDIYHVQIMHGDVITRLKQHAPFIGHYHTAGVPGRGEIDDTQEINYPPIMKAIVETGYQGYVGQEFIPVRDKVASLNQAVRICDV